MKKRARKSRELDPAKSRGRNRVTGLPLPSPLEAMERLRRGYVLLQESSRNLPATVEHTDERGIDLHQDWLPAQVAKYAQILELHYEYAMANGETDKAIQCIMVLLKYSVGMFLGGKGRLPTRKEMEVVEAEDTTVREMSDAELEAELQGKPGSPAQGAVDGEL